METLLFLVATAALLRAFYPAFRTFRDIVRTLKC